MADRALGGLGGSIDYFGNPAEDAIAGWISFGLTNNTGTTLDAFEVRFDGEQWGNGGLQLPNTMVFEYGVGASFQAVANWTAPGPGFDFTSPIFTPDRGPLDGNLAENRIANLGGIVQTIVSPGQTLWLRWVERNERFAEHDLAIDNFSITSVAAVPELSSAAFGAMLVSTFCTLVGRRPASIDEA